VSGEFALACKVYNAAWFDTEELSGCGCVYETFKRLFEVHRGYY
jgi:hypothetical protein